jgi:fructosamine-3-kinase
VLPAPATGVHASDPAVYWGDREVGFGNDRFVSGRIQHFAEGMNQLIVPDFVKRKILFIICNHILNHYNLFGGGLQ